MIGQQRTLPPAAQYVLTHRLPCAGLALVMFGAVALKESVDGTPLAAILSLLGTISQLLTPALFATIVFGGGLTYALQVGGITALAVTALTGFSLMNGLLFLLLYATLPALAARSLARVGGLNRSAEMLAIGMFLAAIAGLQAAAVSLGMEMRALVEQMVTPVFSVMASFVPAGDQAALDMIEKAQTMTIWSLPGLFAFSFWGLWWMDVLLGRRIAVNYGFFRGDHSEMLMIRFNRAIGIALIVTTALANVSVGSVQYIAVSAAIMLACMTVIQGISVAHLWLKARGMEMMLVVMYLLLLIWPPMIVPFIIFGLLDIWFDFRRSITPANGGE